MSDRKQLCKEGAAQLRQMADALDEVDELTPDEVTCHRELGGRLTRAQRQLRALAAQLERG